MMFFIVRRIGKDKLSAGQILFNYFFSHIKFEKFWYVVQDGEKNHRQDERFAGDCSAMPKKEAKEYVFNMMSFLK